MQQAPRCQDWTQERGKGTKKLLLLCIYLNFHSNCICNRCCDHYCYVNPPKPAALCMNELSIKRE